MYYLPRKTIVIASSKNNCFEFNITPLFYSFYKKSMQIEELVARMISVMDFYNIFNKNRYTYFILTLTIIYISKPLHMFLFLLCINLYTCKCSIWNIIIINEFRTMCKCWILDPMRTIHRTKLCQRNCSSLTLHNMINILLFTAQNKLHSWLA